MSSNYTPSPVPLPATITIPDDGDGGAAYVNDPFETLADALEFSLRPIYRWSNGGDFPPTTQNITLTGSEETVEQYAAAFVLTESTFVKVRLQIPAVAVGGQCAVYITFVRSVGGALSVKVPHYALALEDTAGMTTLNVEGGAVLAAGTWDVTIVAAKGAGATTLVVPDDLDTTGGPILIEVFGALA